MGVPVENHAVDGGMMATIAGKTQGLTETAEALWASNKSWLHFRHRAPASNRWGAQQRANVDKRALRTLAAGAGAGAGAGASASGTGGKCEAEQVWVEVSEQYQAGLSPCTLFLYFLVE